MNIKRLILGVALVAMSAGTAFAHHSAAMFNPEQIVEVKGVVKDFQYTNPHSWLLVDVTNADGTVTTWGSKQKAPAR